MEKTLTALCDLLEGELIGDGDTRIRGVNACSLVQDGELTFAESSKLLEQALESRAAGIIVTRDVKDLKGRSGIRVQNPRLAFALLLDLFHPQSSFKAGIHDTAVLGKNVRLGDGVGVKAYAVIGDDVIIGGGITHHRVRCALALANERARAKIMAKSAGVKYFFIFIN